MFEQECRFLSEIRHPNIVQYLGVALDEESGLPILLMELMDDSLTHFLEQSVEPLAYHVQVNISHDIALAIAFLHLNHIVHRDLSSNNVLLIGAGIRAKVTDFGMSKLTELNPRMTGLTKCPGTPAYMSPEALLDPPVYTEKLDCFQIGVLMLQTMTRKFPDPGRAMNRVRSHTGWKINLVPELQRRHNHLSLVGKTHWLLHLVKDCLKDVDTERPSAQQICRRLSALKEASQYTQSLKGGGGERKEGEGVVDGGMEEGKREGETKERDELIQQLREENQAREREVSEKEREVTEKEREVLEKEREVKEKEWEVLEKEREVQILRGEVRVKEEENETVRGVVREREREVRVKEEENVTLRGVVREREMEVREKNEQIEGLRQHLQENNQTIYQLPQIQQFALSSYTYLVSGPGLLSATAIHPTRVVVELSESSGRLKQYVTADLVLQSTSLQATPTSHARQPSAAVAMISPFRYEVTYTAVRRGPHKLHVRVNGSEINGSPFNVMVYPDPTQLGSPVRVVKDLLGPYGIAFNSRGEMIVTEMNGHQVSVFDVEGRRVQIFGSSGDRPEHIIAPSSIAVDRTDNIYVSSRHKLQKFTSSGDLIKCIGQRGSKEAEFNDPRGVTIRSNQVYVCDKNNHRVQVFDLDLKFVCSIGSLSSGRGQFSTPHDVAFDTAGNMYVVEWSNDRVQVRNSSGQFIRMLGQKREGKLRRPAALHVADKYVYVSDWSSYCIAVYETSGQYVTSFGRHGWEEGAFVFPYCITSCVNGFIYVCDCNNNRVQVF